MDYISWIRSKVGHEKIFLNFSGGILEKDGKILLQKRADKNTWGLPGGCMELGESSLDTLKREFMEETGLVIEPIRLINVYTNYHDSYPNGDVAQPIGMIYEVTADDISGIENFKNEETLQLRFFSREEMKNIEIVSKQHVDAINDYYDNSIVMGR